MSYNHIKQLNLLCFPPAGEIPIILSKPKRSEVGKVPKSWRVYHCPVLPTMSPLCRVGEVTPTCLQFVIL